MSFTRLLDFSRESYDFMNSSRVSSDCLCTAPHNHVVMVIRGLTFHLAVSNI